ncbi:MAG: ATP-dependent DNA helicase RecQ, partial [Simkania sp.]|nr:ATP-dependent DNA helicase RecQ [Simkania sp.]
NPKWLPGAQEESPETALLKAKKVREDQKFPGDPFLLSLGLDSYYSKAQRDAIHACLCAPNGHTLLLNLPTGSGKSLCAFVPALLPIPGEYEILGVAPIIVPTVSLALDLAKKLEEWVGHPVVYRPDAPTEQIEEMKGRCENGTQGPLILSPEAFVGKTFQPSLQEAAKKAYLKYLIVDEAHMVLNWGDEFRPEFQRLAPIRKKLLELSKKSPFKTILMSATLTEYHIHWLKKMFSEGDRWFMVHAVRLRPEPIYWQASANVEEERQSWILESLFHLPRPIILYCTQQETCNKWFDILRRNGFQRIGKIHGKTKEKERLEEMEKWNQDEIDLMVATSAFGLGVDKPNVRGVVHAELPESMDRFYQDVGRGGRDGCPTLSLLVYHKKDWEIVHYLTPSLIGMDKGLDRWKSLFEKKKEVKGKANIYLLNLDTEPKLDMGNKQNRLWNLRTLLLIERAKMISLT